MALDGLGYGANASTLPQLMLCLSIGNSGAETKHPRPSSNIVRPERALRALPFRSTEPGDLARGGYLTTNRPQCRRCHWHANLDAAAIARLVRS